MVKPPSAIDSATEARSAYRNTLVRRNTAADRCGKVKSENVARRYTAGEEKILKPQKAFE
jgi:hypothetical protein